MDESWPDWRAEAPYVGPGSSSPLVVEFGAANLDERDLTRAAAASRLLIVVPGVDAGEPSARRDFADEVRRLGGYQLVLHDDWCAGTVGRRLMLPGATEAAGDRLADLVRALHERRRGLRIDVLAHSGGTVVVAKAAGRLAASESPAAFHHLLFLGSPMDPDADLTALLARSAALINVHSAFDKVNRTLADHTVGLHCLPETPARCNLALDRSLAGLLLRHGTVLEPGVDLRLHWALILRDGAVPAAGPTPSAAHPSLEALHRWALGLTPDRTTAGACDLARRLCGSGDLDRSAYGVIAATRLADPSCWPAIAPLLRDPASPPWLRRLIHRHLVTLHDGRHIDLLRWCRKHDPANAESTRDALREIKHQGVEAVR